MELPLKLVMLTRTNQYLPFIIQGTLMLLMFVLRNQLKSSAWAGTHVLFGLVAAGLWTGNSILGYLSSKEVHTGLSVEEIYKLALRRKKRVQLSHQGATQRRAQRL